MHAAGQVHPVGNAERGGLGAGDEIGKRGDGRTGGGGDHHGIGRYQGDEGKVPDRVVGQGFGNCSARGKGARQHREQVAVGL